MENLEIKKFIKSLGVPKLLWDWSIDDKPDRISQVLKEYGTDIADILRSGASIFIKLEDDLYASRLAVYLLKCALREDFIKVAYVTPAQLADEYANSWEGSEMYARLLEADLVVVDQMTQSNFRDGMKISVFTGFITNRLFSEKSTVLVQSDDIIFPQRFQKLTKENPNIVRIM